MYSVSKSDGRTIFFRFVVICYACSYYYSFVFVSACGTEYLKREIFSYVKSLKVQIVFIFF